MRHATPHHGTRAKPKNDMIYRAVALLKGADGDCPATLDEATRSVDWTLATEQPCQVWDWSRGLVHEVLLMKGLRTPSGKLPLLDAHSRFSVSDVLGSVRDIRVGKADVTGRVCFSTVEKAETTFNLVREGHLTDGSIGYTVFDSTWVKEGETAVIGGRTFKGPVKVGTDWAIREFSVTPIGADDLAKARSEPPLQPTSEVHMKKKLLQHLIANHGLRADASADQAWDLFRTLTEEQQDAALRASVDTPAAPAAPGQAAPQGGTLTPEQRQAAMLDARATTDSERERIRREETDRVNELRAIAQRFNIPQATADEWVDKGTDLSSARAAALDIVAARQASQQGGAIVVTADARDKLRAAISEGLHVRSGLVTARDANLGGTEFAGMTLREVAGECLRAANQPARFRNPYELFQRALSTSDFANILGDVTNKAVLKGFDDEPESFTLWVDTSGNLNDFRAHSFARIGEFPSLAEVNPNDGEYTYGKTSDTKETVTALNFGRLIKFSYELMINDDLGELSSMGTKMGAAVRRKQGDLSYSPLTANPTMGDGTALFHADHGNLSAASAAPSNTTLNTVRAAMAAQKDLEGLQVLNVPLTFILAPNALYATVQGLLASITPAQASNVNVFTNLQAVYDARLDAASTTVWYGASTKGKTVKLFALGGQMTPFIDQRAGFETDGMEWKVRWSGAAKAMDYRGLYKYAAS